MDEVKTAELRHYASQYYDPVKAHEYYMRTRELKGRSTSSLNDEGKKVWSYTKNNIKSEKAAKVKEEQEKRALKIKRLRAKAEATREQISSKLKTLNDKLSEDAAAEKKTSMTIRMLILRVSKQILLIRKNRSMLKKRRLLSS